MTADRLARLAALAAALVLPVAALGRRGLVRSQVVRSALWWVVIIAAAWGAVALATALRAYFT